MELQHREDRRRAALYRTRCRRGADAATLSVQHDRDPVAVRLSDGSLRNACTVKLLNKSSSPHRYTLSVSGTDGRLSIVGNEGLSPIEVAADASESLRVTLTAADAEQRDVVFTARDEAGRALSATDRFIER